MSLPEIAKLGHVALVTTDLEKSLWFYKEVIGLEETEVVDGTHYLRAWGDFEHHTLSVKSGDKAHLDHIAWRAKRPEDVEGFAKLLEEAGTEVTWVEAGEEAGQGRAIRFQLPSEHHFEIYYDMEKTLADPSRRSVLKNQTYKSWARGASPRRIDHVNLLTSLKANVISDFLQEKLGFKMREYVKAPDDSLVGAWLSVTPLVHDIAVSHDPFAPTTHQIHHISYWLDNAQDLLRAADILKEHGIFFKGPGKHGISQAMYIYAIDPGSGLRVELFTNGYLIFEPDWEPIEWTVDEMDIGFTFWGDQMDTLPENNPTIEA
ncbi:glyoxalase/bleomycin resistance protein/dioxygenase [Neobacillus bataviensis LMG 21833]|uniref:Glyoxalase/bleomycin resistance protein/dioxygenase n=1 Tax=Neobacillus bataviensis LMG 21833 TaxID=1117379 RepID=K6CYN5_9BACI|nr:VOC family protein [Neobacillus bataviensis]EKN65347.1 glyoxalase/bleomycin resistance protein/dioxygenase [Neobacillus bataviensis LMG 21833]